MKRNSICIIPARIGSKRLKKKNFKKINNKPLVDYTIESAIKSNIFNKIILSSDKRNIEYYKLKYPSLIIEKRPKKLATDKSTVNQVVIDLLKNNKEYSKEEYLCVLYPTAILRNEKDIRNGFIKFRNENLDCLVGVRKININIYKLLLKEKNLMRPIYKDKIMMKSNKINSTFYLDNGSMYFAKINSFLKQKSFFKNNFSGYEMPDSKSIDIDYKNDLQRLKKIFEKNIKM